MAKLRYQLRILQKKQTRKLDFTDILTCPVCNQDKPIDSYLPKEILHMTKHLKREAFFLIRSGIMLDEEADRLCPSSLR